MGCYHASRSGEAAVRPDRLGHFAHIRPGGLAERRGTVSARNSGLESTENVRPG
jgi:hypothetical protein